MGNLVKGQLANKREYILHGNGKKNVKERSLSSEGLESLLAPVLTKITSRLRGDTNQEIQRFWSPEQGIFMEVPKWEHDMSPMQ